MPKTVYFIFISLLVFMLTFDTYVYFASREYFRDAIDQALDAGIVAGTEETDAQTGNSKLNRTLAGQAAAVCLKNNLNLDKQKSRNYLYSDAKFIFDVTPDSNTVQGKLSVKIHFLSLKLLGIDAVPFNITRKQDYLSSYVE